MTTIFWPSDLEIVATTSSLTPLSKNALLKVFRTTSSEKLSPVTCPVTCPVIRISRLSLLGEASG